MRECNQTINRLDFTRASGYTFKTYVALKYLHRRAFRLLISMIFGKTFTANSAFYPTISS